VPKAGLTYAWIDAEATLPTGWQIMGVVRGPREVDPTIRSATWTAWARGPAGDRVEGSGDTPERALLQLAETMRRTGQAFTVH
jgi:hypothetical protein